MIKYYRLLNLFIVCLSLILFILKSPRDPIVFFSDYFFWVGLILLIIGTLIAILKNGTFDFFHVSFKRYLEGLKSPQSKDSFSKIEDEELHGLSRRFQIRSKGILLNGGIYFMLSLILSAISML